MAGPEEIKAEADGDTSRADIACLVCRSRKVKCDRTLPECINCTRLGVNCPGYDAGTQSIPRSEIHKSAESIFKASGVEKRRVGSCAECRSSKHRCTRTRPACRRCLAKNLLCIYPEKQEPLRGVQSPGTGQSPQSAPYNRKHSIVSDFEADKDFLCADHLPNDPALRLKLINAFFDRSYSLRCLDFIHKPSFMQSCERDSVNQDFGEPVLLAVCALGARHIYLDHSSFSISNSPELSSLPGRAWAERARNDVLSDLDSPSVQHLMAMVLLCDYSLRTDQNSMAFILVGFLYRTIRLLALDEPKPQAPFNEDDLIQRDTENRLVWSCFFIDLFMATAGERNTSWGQYSPRIPLPSAERMYDGANNFPCHYMTDLNTIGPMNMAPNLDLSGLILLTARLRTTGLHLIRTFPHDLDTNVWDTSSPFLRTIQQAEALCRSLPRQFHLDEANIPILIEKRCLGGVFFLHFLLHAAVFDLTRPALPGFNFPLAGAFHNASPTFISFCQERCRFHAAQASNLVRQGLNYGRVPFDDIFSYDAALEAMKIQILFSATVNQNQDLFQQTWENLGITLHFFDLFNSSKDGPSQYIRTLLPLCYIFGFREAAEAYRSHISEISTEHTEITGPADAEHLSRFAPFRRARTTIETTKSITGSKASSSQHEPVPLVVRTVASPAATRPTGISDHPPASLQPNYSTMSDQPGGAVRATSAAATFYRRGEGEGAVALGTSMPLPEDSGIPQPSMNHYIRTAGEMSGYLTWQTTELPPWFNYDTQFSNG